MNRNRILLGGGAAVVAIIALGAWWLGFFTDAPDEVDVDVLAEAVQAQADADGADTADAVTSLDGTWTITPVEDQTFIGYRIDEVLTTIGDFEVVGRTAEVAGTLEGSGTSITAVDVVADMTAITTDNPARDNAMRNQALETSDFPEATFSLAEPIDVGVIPSGPAILEVTAVGDLTIHGVTQRVDFPLQAQLVSGSIVVTGQLQIALADYDISAPTAPIVASVEDVALLELSLVFGR